MALDTSWRPRKTGSAGGSPVWGGSPASGGKNATATIRIVGARCTRRNSASYRKAQFAQMIYGKEMEGVADLLYP